MKKTNSTFNMIVKSAIVIAGFISFNASATELPSRDVQIGVNDVFVPSGFDSNSNSYVVVSGVFTNGCYRWKGATVTNKDAFNHEIVTTATVSPGMCLMVLVPFQKEVKIGKLASGDHNLKFMSGDGTYLEKKITIE